MAQAVNVNFRMDADLKKKAWNKRVPRIGDVNDNGVHYFREESES